MFTQFFGNYLLNNRIITAAQLGEALEIKNSVRLKLGVLAINAGLMTSEQVERVHSRQMTEDKRFGDLAVAMGFLTEEQVETLLDSQKLGYLLLGQALVDKGYMSNLQFESALNSYKTLYRLDDNDFTCEQNDKILHVISKFYDFAKSKNCELLTEYVSLFFKNLIRFIGDDFTPLTAQKTELYKCASTASQSINGTFSVTTVIEGNDGFVGFAQRFSGENITENGEFAEACVSEFLNLHNGLFAVNVSNTFDSELSLTPQEIMKGATIAGDDSTYFIPVRYSYGLITLIISE